MSGAGVHRSEQALLNEYKGNLFEYLVAVKLAQNFGLLEKFTLGLADEFRVMFSIQERFIRQRFPHLLQELPLLAQAMAHKICQCLPPATFSGIELIGKSNNQFDQDHQLAGADFLLVGEVTVPISLKLSKQGAFVNTKSGGIKSFLQKYFPFADSGILQTELNLFLEERFEQVATELHQKRGLDYQGNFQNWVRAGHSELPGELNLDEQVILYKLYAELAEKMRTSFMQLYSANAGKFIECLRPLLGMGASGLIQAICYYHNKQGHYQLAHLFCQSSAQLSQELQQMQLDQTPAQVASFEIRFPSKILQIRIKPMNKFTSMAFKINCSVRHNDF